MIREAYVRGEMSFRCGHALVLCAICMTSCVLARNRLQNGAYHINPDGTFPDELRMKQGDLDEALRAATASGSVDAPPPPQGSTANSTTTLKFSPGSEKYRPTVDEVNQNAPTFEVPTANGTVKARPVVTQAAKWHNKTHAGVGTLSLHSPPPPAKKEGPVHSMQWFTYAIRQNNWQDDTQRLQSANDISALGNFVELLVGVRIATPIFGSGFNFCVSKAPDHLMGPRVLERMPLEQRV